MVGFSYSIDKSSDPRFFAAQVRTSSVKNAGVNGGMWVGIGTTIVNIVSSSVRDSHPCSNANIVRNLRDVNIVYVYMNGIALVSVLIFMWKGIGF